MSDVGGPEEKAKRRYIKLKTELSNYFITANVGKNLGSFQQLSSAYLKGPGQYMNLDFFTICSNLEGKGKLSYKNLTVLKEIVQGLPVESATMVDEVDAAQTEINTYLSGSTVQPPAVAHNALPPAVTSTNLKDPGKGFHQKEPHAVSYDDLESIISRNMRNSIGLISVDIGRGTGFRVGNVYIMTAYHVFNDKFEYLRKYLVAFVEQYSIQNKDVRRKLAAALSDQFSGDNGLSLKDCLKQFLQPNQKQLSFAKLAGHLDPAFLQTIENEWTKDTWIEFNIGTEEMLRFDFSLDIPFADADNDVLILQLRIDGPTKIPDPLYLEQYRVDDEMHLIGYLKTLKPEKSLHLSINCQVYCDDRQLATDINKAMAWWRDNLPDASLEPCRYDPEKQETQTGRTILHASKEFEQRSSGCPALVIDDFTTRKLVVQLMYLSGYPTKHFETNKVHSPPLEYCFEAGISMKNIANILLKAGRDDLKKAIFF